MKWLVSLLVFFALIASSMMNAAHGEEPEEDPWGEDTERDTPTEASTPEAETPEAPMRIPEPPDPAPPTVEDTGEYMFLADQLDRTQRLIVLLLIGLLGGYLLPAIFYLPILRRGHMDPGPAAGLCLAIGGLLTGWTVPLLLATTTFQAGVLTPWYLQWDKWAWSGVYFGPLLLLAAVAYSSRAPGS